MAEPTEADPSGSNRDCPAAGDWSEPEGWSRTERAVARVWAELLDVEHIRPEDSFFLLGGRSLAAMKAVIRLRDETGVEVRLPDLFRTPVLREFAALLDARRR
ncbi:MAG: phosphopantetheine-binding protein [Natronosporangium sp.]